MTEGAGNAEASAGGTGDVTLSESRREALTTYRYLRFGILAAVFMLAMSVLHEGIRTHAGVDAPDCWQRSISAYYYTPVRPIFVGGLMLIGFSLIVIRGRTKGEDFCLNVAGMLAPVVALVPTSGTGTCFSIPLSAEPTNTPEAQQALTVWIQANVNSTIQNNMSALFIAGFFAVALILIIGRRHPKMTLDSPTTRFTYSLLLTIALLFIGTLLFIYSDAFEDNAHYFAAIVMFIFLGIVVFINERDCQTTTYKRLYRWIWSLMLLSLAVLLMKLDHKILWLEILEITLFAAFWVVETKEQWTKIEG